MRKIVLAAAALAYVCGAAAFTTARADEPAAAPAKSVQWTEGWKAGVDAAKKSGKLMFVYVHRVKPG
jgi:hypothetical protein